MSRTFVSNTNEGYFRGDPITGLVWYSKGSEDDRHIVPSSEIHFFQLIQWANGNLSFLKWHPCHFPVMA